MKQAIIAIVVCTAGAGAVYGMLSRDRTQPELAPDTTVTTVSIKSGRLPRSEIAAIDKEQTIALARDTVARPQSVSVQPAIDIADPVPPVASPVFLEGVRALGARDSLAALAMRDSLPEKSVERQTLTWATAVSGQRGVPATELLAARQTLAEWPGQADIEVNLEQALYREKSPPDLVMTVFSSRRPETVEGAIMLARAAIATGDKPRATRILGDYWGSETFKTVFEDAILAEFGELLGTDDHRRRMAHLLMAEKPEQARRFADRIGAISLHAAFSAVIAKSKDAGTLLKAVDKAWQTDPLYLYALVKRLRNARDYQEAATLLDTMPRDPAVLGDPDQWWVETRIVSRGLMDLGQAKDAYRLASLHMARSADAKAEAEFHAGWYALRGLKDPQKAIAHFRALLAASPRAHDQARGQYWLGRAIEAARTGNAREAFRKAADYPATFYGQVAAARLGVAIAPGDRYGQIPDIASAFAARPQVQAISLLEQAGEPGRARRLYLALARDLDNPSELQALAEIALRDHGPSLALAIGKAALRQGHDPGLAAFPLGAIPDTADISGAGRALAYAIARQESAFNPAAVSPANARGLLQLLPSTAKKVASKYQMAWAEEKLTNDPGYNATLGSHYLGEQLARFGGSYILTFAAYNAGPNRIPQWIKRYGDPRGRPIDDVVDWVENIPFTETRDYVQKVMENYQIYKSLLGEKTDIVVDLTAGRR